MAPIRGERSLILWGIRRRQTLQVDDRVRDAIIKWDVTPNCAKYPEAGCQRQARDRTQSCVKLDTVVFGSADILLNLDDSGAREFSRFEQPIVIVNEKGRGI